MWLKVSRSSFQQTQRSFACTDAARGALYKSASSPNASPGSHVFTTTSEPSFVITHGHGALNETCQKCTDQPPRL